MSPLCNPHWTQGWKLRQLTVINLTKWNGHCGGDNLWLAVAQWDNYRSRYDFFADDVIVDTELPIVVALAHEDLNRLTLWCPIAVVDIVEVARLALVEVDVVAECQAAIGTMSEAGGEECTGLRRIIEL